MIELGDRQLTLEDFRSVIFDTENVEISASGLDAVRSGFNFLQEFSKDKVIYGINTGFGPMAQYKIDTEDQLQMQYNLIRSHSSGMGAFLSPELAKAVLLARLNSLCQGYSGIHEQVVTLLCEFINRDIAPVVYEHGSVGASGDLVQLAHVANALIGEGKVIYKDEIRTSGEVLEETGIKPLQVRIREGLALINGTSAMSGIGMVTLLQAQKLLDLAVSASVLINEIAESYDDHFSKELNQVKHHRGQQEIAELMRKKIAGSQLIKSREEHLYNKVAEEKVFHDKVQEYYSLRCVPQILGPVHDTLKTAEKILVDEINSANDNPIIDKDNNNVYHGGNFHGDYISLEMDKVKIAVTKLSMLLERQLNFLMNKNLNAKLPPFVNLGKLGINFGMQGVQFTAVSTVAENQTLSYPNYLHSIPNNNDNQDIVSMGTNSAVLASKVVDNTFQVLSIHLVALSQSVSFLKADKEISPASAELIEKVRSVIPVFTDDSSLSQRLMELKDKLKTEIKKS